MLLLIVLNGCLNPCSNGILKYICIKDGKTANNAVLILVLMEY